MTPANKSNPQRLLAGSLLFAAMMLLWLAISPYRAHSREKQSAARDLRVVELAGTIRRLDDALTISARTTAATGDSVWERTHNAYEPELESAARELYALAPDRTMLPGTSASHQKSRGLTDIEHSAFQLVHQGKRNEASQLLFGKNYIERKKEYAKQLEMFLALWNEQRRSKEEQEDFEHVLATVLAVSIAFILFGAWVAIVRILAGASRTEEQTARLMELEHTVTGILAESGDVEELGPGIIKAVCSALNWESGAWWLIDRDRRRPESCGNWRNLWLRS